MRAIEQVAKKIWRLKSDCNVYLLDFDEPIVIDTGRRSEREKLLMYLDKIRTLGEVKHVIFTHLHHDHIGNFDLFTNAKFYASAREIESWKNDAYGTILNEDMVNKFKVDLIPAADLGGLTVVETPGHTKGSICLWYEPEKILFSGDTIFANKITGRVDLPSSVPAEMPNSVMKLVDYNFKILLPGHDY